MKELLRLVLLPILALVAPLHVATASDRWQAPFETSGTMPATTDSALTLGDVLQLVAAHNPTLRSLDYQRQAARYRIYQAGRRPNPELETEIEEIGWDAPGLSEPEITVAVSQELELFGQRGARKNLAETNLNATELDARIATFDLYVETRARFYLVAHAQERARLSAVAIALAANTVENIEYRIERGAALQSELLLARLEYQRIALEQGDADQELAVARLSLAALWNGAVPPVSVETSTEPDFSRTMQQITDAAMLADSTREVMARQLGTVKLRAEKRLAVAEGKPNITVSGGFRRVEADKSNSFLVGLALPLPFFDRNRGTTASLEEERRALEHEIERARAEDHAAVEAGTTRLRYLMKRHTILDGELLSTAAEAYRTLQDSYEAGRLPYTSLLEAERFLNDLSFEHNDILLSIYEQILALERISGVILHASEDTNHE